MPKNPFAASGSKPGHGKITLASLPSSASLLRDLSYQYPLKLIAPTPRSFKQHETSEPFLVHTVFLLTYGGGLVGGDAVHLEVSLASTTRLVLRTQGSTKIFKSPSANVVTRQHMNVELDANASLCYLPDPVQPFADSSFEQQQIYNIHGENASLCVCDWVCEGRPARDESWAFRSYRSKNEVWWAPPAQKRRLMLRDNLILDARSSAGLDVATRVDGMGVFGTLIICGPQFEELSKHFLDEFRALPRIGSKQWDVQDDDAVLNAKEKSRAARVEIEKAEGLLWTCSSTRGFVVVKFGARTVDGAKTWLRRMLSDERSIEREFGERALLCLR